MVTKALAGITTAVVLVGGGALAYTQTQSAPEPRTDLAAPVAPVSHEDVTITCPRPANRDYPGPAFTNTRLSRFDSGVIQYGATNGAWVNVNSSVQGWPKGAAHVVVDGRHRTANVSRNRIAHVGLPRWLKPGHYAVRACYAPSSDSHFERSQQSNAKVYRVVKANSFTSLNARDVSRSQRPRVGVRVSTTTGATPTGRVRVVIAIGRVGHAKTLRLREGRAVARFDRVRRTGRWDVKSVYLGSDRVRRDKKMGSFRNTRR
ncbi:MAG: hypothetical protein ACRDOY_01820 [Nocardioidaceae bacterium]